MSNDLKNQVRDYAHQLGFQLVGFISPTPSQHHAVFEQWLDLGYHGQMQYLDTERSRTCRKDPLAILPECASILALGMQYPASSPQLNSVSASLTGQVAAYAQGEDYHELIPPKLRQIVSFLEETLGHPIPHRVYTDTGPILEREISMRAGLGWIGKNTCLIHPRLGSYILLAEILLGYPFEPDPPFTSDHCGTCTRCLDACPTGCILPGRIVDSTRCISYLTIELKGSIPRELRPFMGNWVFGCDVCQQVCPWNIRFANSATSLGFPSSSHLAQPDLVSELRLTPEGFNQKFRHTPVKRTKRRGYLRNVAVALGNSCNPAAVPALAEVLAKEPEPLVRAHAAWALRQINTPESQAILQQVLITETDREVRAEIQSG